MIESRFKTDIPETCHSERSEESEILQSPSLLQDDGFGFETPHGGCAVARGSRSQGEAIAEAITVHIAVPHLLGES